MHDGDLIEYEGGEVLASLEERTVTGLLVPFNELGQTNAGRFMVEAGSLALPSDPSVITLNLDHDRSQNVGRASRVWEEPRGIFATFHVASTPEGDAYLADVTSPTGERKRLSGEFHTAIMAGKAVKGSGRLWGGAAVRMGAFPSAMVLAEDRSSASKYITEYTDESGVTWRRVEETVTTTTDTDTGVEMTSVTTVTEETAGEQEAPVAEETTTVEAGAVPLTQNPAPAAVTLQRGPDLATVFASIATIRNKLTRRQEREAAEAVLATLPDTHMILAALSDVTPGGATPLTAAGIIQHDWVGQIAQGTAYNREYINLCNLGSQISLGGKKGYKVHRGTAASPVTGNFDGEYAGNKSELKSYKGFTTPHTSVLDQFAVAEDIARAFYDLPGGAEAVAAFLSLIVEDHLVWSDTVALEYIVETAGAPITPNTAAYSTAYPEAVGMLLQGIITLKRKKADGRRDNPSFAIANDAAYEEIIYAAGGAENLPAFINIAMNTLGEGSADGVQVVTGDTGIEDTSSVIVGADYAIDFDEPAGGPLLIDALDIAKGGVDKAVHGYLQTFVKRPEAIVLIGEADV
jgi:hypothetical protein